MSAVPNTPAPITDTGMRGFLKWFKQNQPGIYQKIAPQLPALVPNMFSQYHAGGWKIAGLSAIDARKKLASIYRGKFSDRSTMGNLGQYANYAGTGVGSAYANYVGQAAGGSLAAASAATPVDVATAANIGPTASNIASTVGSLINTASTAYLTVNAAQAQSNLVNTNLQRAQAGLPPLTTAISSLGVPIITGTSLGNGNIMLLLLIAGAVVIATSGKHKVDNRP